MPKVSGTKNDNPERPSKECVRLVVFGLRVLHRKVVRSISPYKLPALRSLRHAVRTSTATLAATCPGCLNHKARWREFQRSMIEPDPKSQSAPESVPLDVPKGAPSWVTETIIEKTLETWQPYYSYRLTPEDALVIIKNVGRLFDVMSRGGGG